MTLRNDWTRREWLAKTLAAATILGSGIRELDALDSLKAQVKLVRQDITEGKTGLPTLLGFLVVNADTCRPVEGAMIDIWHTDRDGHVIGGSATRVNPYLFNSKLILDNSLVALKVIAIRTNPTTCAA